MKDVRIGLIGTGYIGKAHAIADAQVSTVFACVATWSVKRWLETGAGARL